MRLGLKFFVQKSVDAPLWSLGLVPGFLDLVPGSLSLDPNSFGLVPGSLDWDPESLLLVLLSIGFGLWTP